MDSIFVIQGNNGRAISSEIKRLLSNFNCSEDNLIILDMDENSVDTLIEELTTVPFLIDKKIVVIKNLSSLYKSSEVARIVNIIQNPLDNIKMIFITSSIDDNNELNDAFRHLAKVTKIEEIKDKLTYVRNQFKEKNVLIDEFALKWIADNVELSLLDGEIEKIAIYAGDDIITLEMAKKTIYSTLENNIFDLLNAVIEGQKVNAFKMYSQLIDNNNDEMAILNLLERKFDEIRTTKLLLEKGYTQSQIAEYFHVSNSRAYYFLKNAKAMSLRAVRNYMNSLLALDCAIKSGQIDKKRGLEQFMLGV